MSTATIEAVNARYEKDKKQVDCEFQFKKGAEELKAVRVLFNEDSEDRKMYRNALKRERLCKLLEEDRSLKSLRTPFFSGGDVGEL